jgi:hypothetical protein
MAKEITREATQSTAAREGFRHITGNTTASIFIRDKGENHPNSMKVLEKANLDPFTRQEILKILNADETLKEALKGKWFWIAGEGLHKELQLYTIDANGELVERQGKVSVENTVRVWNGNKPLSLLVLSDYCAALCGRRFGLGAYDEPHLVAPVVVGKAKPEVAAALRVEEK